MPFPMRDEFVNKFVAVNNSAGGTNSNYLYEKYKNSGKGKFEKQNTTDFTKKQSSANYQNFASPTNENAHPNLASGSSNAKELNLQPTTNYYSTQKVGNVVNLRPDSGNFNPCLFTKIVRTPTEDSVWGNT